MASANRLIVATLIIAALAIGFWVLALAPKREEASKLSGEVDQGRAALAEAQSREAEAAEARREFPADYQQLVVLGEAVPSGDDTSSLMVELSHVARKAHVKFNSFQLSSAGESEGAAPAAAPAPPTPTLPAEGSGGAVPASASAPPTEAAASLLPLGATIGTAGLGVMPYSLSFTGSFFQVADFIKQIDSLVKTGKDVAVNGRLVTLDAFSLSAAGTGFPELEASFSVTTYLTPPSEGVTAGATPSTPMPAAAETATEPSSPAAPEAGPETSATVSSAK